MSADEDPKLGRRERRRLEVRDRIIETAALLFESKGYEATTVKDIAERSDIAHGTFFNHFPTKLELLQELSDRALQNLYENIEEVRKESGSFSDQLIAVFECASERAEEMGPKARDLLGAMMALAYPRTAMSDDRRMREMFRGLLEDGRAAGGVREDVDLEVLLQVVVGSWYSMFLSWVHFDDYPLRKRASETAHFLARTITETD